MAQAMFRELTESAVAMENIDLTGIFDDCDDLQVQGLVNCPADVPALLCSQCLYSRHLCAADAGLPAAD